MPLGILCSGGAFHPGQDEEDEQQDNASCYGEPLDSSDAAGRTDNPGRYAYRQQNPCGASGARHQIHRSKGSPHAG